MNANDRLCELIVAAMLGTAFLAGCAGPDKGRSLYVYRCGSTTVKVEHQGDESLIRIFCAGQLTYGRDERVDGNHGFHIDRVKISPDARWVAYQQTSSGGHMPYRAWTFVVDAATGTAFDVEELLRSRGLKSLCPTGPERGQPELAWLSDTVLQVPISNQFGLLFVRSIALQVDDPGLYYERGLPIRAAYPESQPE